MWETATRTGRSQVIDGEPGRVWSLLSSPEAWSLRPEASFMFNVPDAERTRFYVGPTRQGTGTVVFEISEELPGELIRLRVPPPGNQVFTLSVEPGKRGTTKASVEVSGIVPRDNKIGYEARRRAEVKAWLSAMAAVIEGRTPWPDAKMPPDLRQKCLARPQMNDPLSASASVLISAGPGAVWDAVHSPETARIVGPRPPVYAGYVPDTPRGEAGEMQYHISRRASGQLIGTLAVVTEVTDQRSALTHIVGHGLHLDQHYLLTPESQSGPTRLDLTCRLLQPKSAAGTAEAARSQMAESLKKVASDYKSLIEEAGRHA